MFVIISDEFSTFLHNIVLHFSDLLGIYIICHPKYVNGNLLSEETYFFSLSSGLWY